MASFERALEIGVDALELDVQLTRDQHLVVHHDESCARMTGAQTTWAALDFADARALDAGWGFVAPDGTRPFAGHGVHVATFEEVLDAFPGMRLNVDVKVPNAVDATIELVKRMKAEDRVTLASFATTTSVSIRRKGFGGETALSGGEVGTLISLPALLWRQLPLTGTAAQVPTHRGPLRFDRAPFIAKCHSVGLRVDFWTINDPDEVARLLALGADGIMTDDPATMKPLFAPQ